ncbi:MAG: hypothetical protein PHE26_10950 [Syntrophomonadaceae bacterium]|nr:hypothetical protein [Syntrophomonadaceae bacterium]
MAFENNKEQIDAIARKYADMVKNEINSVESICMFGSQINGNPGQGHRGTLLLCHYSDYL